MLISIMSVVIAYFFVIRLLIKIAENLLQVSTQIIFTPHRSQRSESKMPFTGRKKKPSALRDYYSISDIEEYEYNELREILAQDELSTLFDKGNLGYAKWDGNTGTT